MLNNRKYVIISAGALSKVVFSKVLETSKKTLRWNKDDTKTFVKYEGAQPSFLKGKTVLSHEAILAELQKDEWQGAA